MLLLLRSKVVLQKSHTVLIFANTWEIFVQERVLLDFIMSMLQKKRFSCSWQHICSRLIIIIYDEEFCEVTVASDFRESRNTFELESLYFLRLLDFILLLIKILKFVQTRFIVIFHFQIFPFFLQSFESIDLFLLFLSEKQVFRFDTLVTI